MPTTRRIPIADIRIGKRCRRDFGDLEELADSIRKHGLIQPPIVTTRLELVAGSRRLKALQRLGHTEVDVYVTESLLDALALLNAEYAENTCRKDFTPLEAVNMTSMIWQIEQKKSQQARTIRARQNQQYSENKHEPRPVLDPKKPPPIEKPTLHATRDRVAATVGMSGKTLEKARQVAAAAESDPEQFGAIADEMERTGKVDPAHKAIRQAQGSGRTTYDDHADWIKTVRKKWAALLARRGNLERMVQDLSKGQKKLLREPLDLLLTELRQWRELLA